MTERKFAFLPTFRRLHPPGELRVFALMLTVLLLTSCGNRPDNGGAKSGSYQPTPHKALLDSLPELTEIQQSSFGALNELQVGTDTKNRLYSTFADIHQPCYPPDTSFVLSQDQFVSFLQSFVNKH